jgi:hypothetical protein
MDHEAARRIITFCQKRINSFYLPMLAYLPKEGLCDLHTLCVSVNPTA